MRARVIKKIVVTILALLIFFMYISVNAIAEKSRGIDVFVILDNSGSMVKNDKDNLRFQVVKNFIHMMNFGDRIGVMNFDTETQMQLPISEIKNQDDKRLLEEQIVPSRSYKDTDVYTALSVAFDEMQSNVLSDNTKFFILVTDGVIDPSPEFRNSEEVRNEYFEQLDLLIKEYEENVWPIFVVFLNPKGLEDDYLKDIAKKTGGNFYNLDDANQFEEIFGRILNRIGTIKGDVEKAIETKLSEEVGQLPEIKVDIISPNNDGKYYNNEKMNIETQILGDDKKLIGNHPAVIDSFAVEIVAPSKKDKVHEELNDQGDLGDAKKGDGVYSVSFLPKETGIYELRFKAVGKYNGIPFISESYADIEILSPAIINMEIDGKNTGISEVMQGKKLKVYLDFAADIDSKQIIEFTSSPDSEISVKPIRVAVFPNNPSRLILEVPISRKVPPNEYKIHLFANIFGQGVKLEPHEIVLDIKVIPYEFFVSNQLTIYIMLIVVIIGFLASGSLILLRIRGKTMENKNAAIDKGRDVLEKFDVEG